MSLSLKSISFEPVKDRGAQEAFKVVRDALVQEPLITSGFKRFELSFTASGTFKVAHGLGFTPKDVIQTSLTGTGALTWNYDKFDGVNLNITVTGPCTVRAFIGASQGS